MSGNPKEYVSETFSGLGRTVTWRLRNWVSSKEVHVTGSCCEFGLPTSNGVAMIRYGLNWVKHRHLADAGVDNVTRYLALTVEPSDLPCGPVLLKVKLSWNLNKNTGVHHPHPSTFEACVRAEMGKKVTVFDNILPDDTWTLLQNGEYQNLQSTWHFPLPEGNDLIFSINTIVVSSKNSRNCVA